MDADGNLRVGRLAVAAAVTAVFLFGLWIRLLPADGMRYLQALDPYQLARMSEAIVEHGHLPAVDAWRYFPYLAYTHAHTLGNIFIPAYLYPVAAAFGVSFLAYAKTVPALFGAGMIVVTYFIGRTAFDRATGVAAAFFLASSAAVLQRSSAGWYEKEPIGGFFILLTLYCFLRAWDRTSWPAGITAGISLAAAATSWGGASYIYLLLPLVTFIVLFLDEDVEQLVAAYTPTILLGHLLAVTANPSRASLGSVYMFAGFGVLIPLWTRHLVARHDLVPAARRRYVVPGMTAGGFVALLLSPLYSQWVAQRFFKVFGIAASGGPYGTIGTTVAENAPASIGQLVSQLGAVGAARTLPAYLAPLARFVGGWQFALVGLAAVTVWVTLMLLRRYGGIDAVPARLAYGAVPAVLYVAAFLTYLSTPQLGVSLFIAGTIAFIGAALLSAVPGRDTVSVAVHWPLLLLFLWAATAIYGVTQRSRLMFLAAQPVAVMAGFAVAAGMRELRRSPVWAQLVADVEEISPRRAFAVAAVVLLAPVVLVNAASAYGMGSSVGGSPNQAWMENLDYMRTETPVDSVILSWWDYGYWFEAIGGRAAIADGGNWGHMEIFGIDGKINFPLADFLTATNTSRHMDWLESLSVDYVVLDSTMIGKYSAVSTIHNRGGQPNAMQTFDCRTQQRSFGGQQRQVCQQRQANNRTYIVYAARGAEFLVPVDQDLGTPDAPPLLRTSQGTARVAHFCSTDGYREYDTSGRSVPGCVAWHPLRQQRQIVFIPQEVMRSTLVKLYVMDGYGLPQFEKVPGGSNGFVKMWEVDYDE